MTHWLEASAKPKDLREVPGPIGWKERTDSCKLFSDPHSPAMASAHRDTPQNKLTLFKFREALFA